MRNAKTQKPIAILIAIVVACFCVFFVQESYASYKTTRQDDIQTLLAVPVVDYQRKSIIRNKSAENEYQYEVNNDGTSFVFMELKPEDAIDYTFTLSNFDGDGNQNGVAIKITVTFVVYLEYIEEDSGNHLHGHFYTGMNESSGILNGGSMNVYRGETDMATSSSGRVDYTCTSTFVEELDNNGTKYKVSRIGTVWNPYESDFTEEFTLKLRLPKQAKDMSAYESDSTRLYVNLQFDVEQIIGEVAV